MPKTAILGSAFVFMVAAAARAQQFQDQTASRLPAQAIWTEGVCAGDVNGDGYLDLVYAKGDGYSSAGTARQSTICINNGAGVFTDQTATRFPVLLANAKDIELFDIDNDGDLDVILPLAFVQQPRIWINDGNGFFTDGTAARFPTVLLNCFKCAGGDVDNDGDIDLVFTDSGATAFNGAGGQPRVFMNNGAGYFTDETSTRMPVIAIVSQLDAHLYDVDGDFDLDLIVVSKEGTPSKLFINNGAGVFSNGPVLPSDGNSTYNYGVADLDGDGDADIFLIGVNNNLDEGVFLNSGSGVFTLSANAVVGNPSSDDNAVALADIDNTGRYSAAIAALSTAERILVNNGSGVFTYNSSLITSFIDSSLDIKFADVNNDGRLDIVTAVGESGAFQNRIYMNVTGPVDTLPPIITPQVLGSGTAGGAIPVRCKIRDQQASETDPAYQSVVLHYTINGGPAATAPMRWAGPDVYRGVIPFAEIGASVTYWVTATDRHGNPGTSASVTFSPTGLPAAPMLLITTTGVGDVSCTIYNPQHPGAEEYLFYSLTLPAVPGTGPFFGLSADAFLEVSEPTGIPPLHDFLNASGLQQTYFGPGSLPNGLVFDARSVILASPPVWTNILRVTI